MPTESLPPYVSYPFNAVSAADWAARIAGETKGRADVAQLTRPTDDGTVVRPVYTADDHSSPAPLALQPGWLLLEDLSALERLDPVSDLLRTSAAHAGAVMVSAAAATQARQLLGPSFSLHIRLSPEQVGFESLRHADDHYLVELLSPEGELLLSGNYWNLRAQHSLLIDLCPLAEAGANAAQQLGVLHQLLERVASLKAPRLWVNLAVGLSVAPELAKLRAARRLVQRHAPATALTLHATTARWPLSLREPHTNLIRTTTQAFTAIAGGADAISIYPYDGVSSLPSAEGIRLARNISHLLRHESYLYHVADPAAGSHTIEALTDELSEAAQQFAEQITAQGGVTAAYLSGWLQQQVANVAAERAARIAQGDAKTGAGRVIVGVNAFRAPGEVTPPAADRFDPTTAPQALNPWRGPAAAE